MAGNGDEEKAAAAVVSVGGSASPPKPRAFAAVIGSNLGIM